MADNASNSTDVEAVPLHVSLGAIGYAALGLPTALCNVFIVASIANYRAMRRDQALILLMALSAADALNMFCFTSVGECYYTYITSSCYICN